MNDPMNGLEVCLDDLQSTNTQTVLGVGEDAQF